MAAIMGIKVDREANMGAAITDHKKIIRFGFMDFAVTLKISGPILKEKAVPMR